MNKALLRRFGGSHKAVRQYCHGRGFDERDLNHAYTEGTRHVFYYGGRYYTRPALPKSVSGGGIR